MQKRVVGGKKTKRTTYVKDERKAGKQIHVPYFLQKLIFSITNKYYTAITSRMMPQLETRERNPR